MYIWWNIPNMNSKYPLMKNHVIHALWHHTRTLWQCRIRELNINFTFTLCGLLFSLKLWLLYSAQNTYPRIIVTRVQYAHLASVFTHLPLINGPSETIYWTIYHYQIFCQFLYHHKYIFYCRIYSCKAAELYTDGICFDYKSGCLSLGPSFVVSFSITRREICHGGLLYSYLIMINGSFLSTVYTRCRWSRKTRVYDF
jgi:hypothetical protein